MTLRTVALIFLVLSTSAFGQDTGSTRKDFAADFTQILKSELNEDELQSFYQKHHSFFEVDDGIVRMVGVNQAAKRGAYPLSWLRKSALYRNNIDRLLVSTNPQHRLISAAIVGAAGDITREEALVIRLGVETYAGVSGQLGLALLYLKTERTTELFDFLVKFVDFGDAHLVPLYFMLDRRKLQETAYARITSNEKKAKILAAQTLAVTKRTPRAA